MALRFKCPNCNGDITVRYVTVGEDSECKNCRHRTIVPQDAIEVSLDETGSMPRDSIEQRVGANHVDTEVEIESSIPPSKMPPPAPNGFTIEIAGRGYNLASRGRRWLGQFLDGIILLISIGITFAIVAPQGFFGEKSRIALATFWAVLVFGLFFEDGLKNGQSLGKKILSMRVISSNNASPCTYGKSFLRNFLSILPLFNLIDVLFIFGRKRQRLGDKIARTVVVTSDDKSAFYVYSDDRHIFRTIAVLFTLFVLVYATLTLVDENGKHGRSEKFLSSIDGKCQVTIPSDWAELPELHDDASLAAGNKWKEMYLIVLSENKNDFDDMNLVEYSRITTGFIVSDLSESKISESRELTISHNKAIQHEITGADENVKVTFLHTCIDGKENYYQVMAWTLSSRYNQWKETLEQVVQSFQNS